MRTVGQAIAPSKSISSAADDRCERMIIPFSSASHSSPYLALCGSSRAFSWRQRSGRTIFARLGVASRKRLSLDAQFLLAHADRVDDLLPRSAAERARQDNGASWRVMQHPMSTDHMPSAGADIVQQDDRASHMANNPVFPLEVTRITRSTFM
jgi:hypothetical protein